MSRLDETLKALIARDLGVTPTEITPEFIRKWRKSTGQAKKRLEFRSHYGGYRGSSLRNLTSEEIESNRKRAEAFLDRFVEEDIKKSA